MSDGDSQASERAERVSDRALERRVRRWLLTGPFDCFVQTAPGLEPLLLDELATDAFGAPGIAERGGVSIALDHADIMRANLSLRTASRVLLRLATFPAATPEMLVDRGAKIPWEIHLGAADTYRVTIAARASRLQAGDAVQKLVARAIARRLRAFGLRAAPSDDAALEFRIRLLDDRCTVSLNTSGEHLHRRGVRRHVHDAPLRETVAAALALDAYRGHDTIVDAFCGSGTLLIEMADVIARRPPGRGRSFAFEAAAWHRPGRWREVRRAAAASAATPAASAATPAASAATPAASAATPAASAPDVAAEPARLLGIDVDPAALAAARHNLAGPDYRHVELARGDATRIDLDGFGARRGLLIGNLPYGVRLGDRAEATTLIRRFLDRCAQAATPWDVAFLTTDPASFAEHPGLRVDRTRVVESGGLHVTLVVGRTRPRRS